MSQEAIDLDGVFVKNEVSDWKEECVSPDRESGDELLIEINVKEEADNGGKECTIKEEMEWENHVKTELVFVSEIEAELERRSHGDLLQNARPNPQHENQNTPKNPSTHTTTKQQQGKIIAAYLLNKGRKKQKRIQHHKEPKEQDKTCDSKAPHLCKDEDKFKEHFRMSVKSFEEILKKIRPHLKCCYTSPKKRLAVTMTYLATGATIYELQQKYKMGSLTIRKVIMEILQTIYEILKKECLPEPNLNWQNVAEGFEKNANFPNCAGAVGGKTTPIVCPIDGPDGAKFESVKILAMCDTNYRFTYVDVGCGSTAYDKCCENMLKHLKMPPSKSLPGTSKALPYVTVSDDDCFASVLTPYEIKESKSLHGFSLNSPFPKIENDVFKKKIFNYRINRAIRYVEGALAIMTNKFSILQHNVVMSASLAEAIVKAVFVLHNFIIDREGYTDEETMVQIGLSDFDRDESLESINTIRDSYADYFVSEGAVPWQNHYISIMESDGEPS